MSRTLMSLAVAVTAALSLARADEAGAKPVPAPELTGVTGWVNSKPLKLADLKGKVVVLHFWTHGCINCVNNYPHYRAWGKRYQGKDVAAIGVHTPEFDREKKVAAIEAAVKKHELPFAVAVDNDGKTWRAWNNRYWPCVYLVDKGGNVRYHWEGELGKDGEATMRRRIDELLREGK
ncbi:MAG: redoxin domain-containing protein [Gemmataceae bacterium]